MPESIGEKLRAKRLELGLEIEDVARDTKIRAPRIADLESDNFTQFASLVYAKGFLKKYAEYLGVDASDYLERLQAKPDSKTESYQYLSQEPKPDLRAKRSSSRRPLSKLLSGLALIVVALLVVGIILYLRSSWQRLYPDEAGGASVAGEPAATATAAAQPETSAPTPPAPTAATGVTTNPPQPPPRTASQTPLPATTPEPPAPPVATPAPADGMAGGPPDDDRPIMRAIPVGQDDESRAAPPASEPARQVSVRANSRTWVKIIRDDRDAEPVYEDWLAPEDAPLSFAGTTFWITVMDAGAVEIRRDGELVELEGTAVVID